MRNQISSLSQSVWVSPPHPPAVDNFLLKKEVFFKTRPNVVMLYPAKR